ncbi:unnamed protein product, partial [Laminaria digitata]
PLVSQPTLGDRRIGTQQGNKDWRQGRGFLVTLASAKFNALGENIPSKSQPPCRD